MKPWENYEIAANGRPIKDNFADWFEDSKVVDAGGQPLVVYHGTDQDFDIFYGANYEGWFTKDPKVASAYAREMRSGGSRSRPNVIAALLSMQNPLRLDFDMNEPATAAEEIAKLLGLPHTLGYQHAFQIVNDTRFISALQRHGYDGVIANERGIATYAPVRPEQIKSAIGNSGLYNKNAPSMSDPIESRPELNAATVRISDIVPHETPNPRAVAKIAKAIKAGEVIPPIIIDRNACKHWTQGPEGMVFTGYGYGLLDGHHRLEAYKQVFGVNHILEVELHKRPTASPTLKGLGI